MLHHVEIYVSDLRISRKFWLGLLGNIGWSLRNRWKQGFTLSNGTEPYLTFVEVEEKYRDLHFHRCGVGLNHLAFAGGSRENVDKARQHCQEHGLSLLYDDRYPFATGGNEYYALFVEDPDRIKVEIVATS